MNLLFIILGAGMIGFIFRSSQIKKKQGKITELRKEMVSNHAYILELQKEYVALESQLKSNRTPVLPMHSTVKDQQDENKRVSDGSR